jgi:hypothetical protein
VSLTLDEEQVVAGAQVAQVETQGEPGRERPESVAAPALGPASRQSMGEDSER